MASEAKILQPIARVVSVYCRINHELHLQTVMRSCYNLVKYCLILGGNECRPKGNAFGKRRFPSDARSAEEKKRPEMKLNTT